MYSSFLVVNMQYLKEKNKNIRIGVADPMGACMYNFYEKGVLESSGTSVCVNNLKTF
jgi:hypothetical protein